MEVCLYNMLFLIFRTADVTGFADTVHSGLNISMVESVSMTMNPEFRAYDGSVSSDSDDTDDSESRSVNSVHRIFFLFNSVYNIYLREITNCML